MGRVTWEEKVGGVVGSVWLHLADVVFFVHEDGCASLVGWEKKDIWELFEFLEGSCFFRGDVGCGGFGVGEDMCDFGT